MNTTLRTLLIALLTLIGTAANAWADPDEDGYSVSVGGISYDEPSFGQNLGGGTATYDPASHTLTLRNATLRGKGIAIYGYDDSEDAPAEGLPFTIRLEGKNTIETDSESGIQGDNIDLYITGNGSLTYRTQSAELPTAISSTSISITDGCQLELAGAIEALIGVEFDDADVHITDGGVSTHGGIWLRECTITQPESKRPICTDESGKWTLSTICLPDGSPAKEIRIIRRKGAGNTREYGE